VKNQLLQQREVSGSIRKPIFPGISWEPVITFPVILNLPFRAYQKAIDISGRHNWTPYLLTILLEPSEFQQIPAANSIYRELLAKEKTGFVNPFLLAVASAALGKNEDAIRYTKQAIDRHDPLFPLLHSPRPESKAFRAIPQIIEMLKSIGISL
jgi:hypothetical protein